MAEQGVTVAQLVAQLLSDGVLEGRVSSSHRA
jgi:hypothetical protein